MRSVIEAGVVDELWCMPCCSGSSWGKELLSAKQRLEIVSCGLFDPVKLSRVEIDHGFERSWQTLHFLKNEHPQNTFCFVYGADWDITRFERFNYLQRNAIAIRIARPGYKPVNFGSMPQIVVPSLVPIRLSSSLIRQRVHRGLAITGLVPPAVENYIEQNKLYR